MSSDKKVPNSDQHPRPEDFPLGSAESRAAARTQISLLREGDRGKTEGISWYITKDPATGRLMVVGFSFDPPEILSGPLDSSVGRDDLVEALTNKARELRVRCGTFASQG